MKDKSMILSFALAAATAMYALAAPTGYPNTVDRVAQNEGNRRTEIGVLVTSFTWTVVISTDIRRRSAILHTTQDAPGDVCLRFASDSTACTRAASGIQLEPGASYSDFSEAVLYGRAEALTPGTTLYGFSFFDIGDSTVTY